MHRARRESTRNIALLPAALLAGGLAASQFPTSVDVSPQGEPTMTDEIEQWWANRSTEISPSLAPGWMIPLVRHIETVDATSISETDPPACDFGERQAAVLIVLASDGDSGPSVVLQQRSPHLRHHPGEISFPGGRREPGDSSPVDTALREANEEVGLQRADVDPVALFPRLLIRATGFEVTAVVAHWRDPTTLTPDATETTAVQRVPLSELADTSGWYDLRHPIGWNGRAIQLPFGTLWGYTADLIRATIHGIGPAGRG
jgi:8-oxo-dGTP pyrophosphatase MutT (NUDIX family)